MARHSRTKKLGIVLAVVVAAIVLKVTVVNYLIFALARRSGVLVTIFLERDDLHYRAARGRMVIRTISLR